MIRSPESIHSLGRIRVRSACPDIFLHPSHACTHTMTQNSGITITVGFKSLKKLVDRLTQYLFIGVTCMLKWVQQGQELFKPVQNYWQKAGPNSSTFLHSSCLSREGCMNLHLNLLLISAHKNPILELLVKGEFPTLIYLHFIFQTHSLLA